MSPVSLVFHLLNQFNDNRINALTLVLIIYWEWYKIEISQYSGSKSLNLIHKQTESRTLGTLEVLPISDRYIYSTRYSRSRSSNLTSILQFSNSASTRLRLQSFDICLDDEPRVGTPLRRYLLDFVTKISKLTVGFWCQEKRTLIIFWIWMNLNLSMKSNKYFELNLLYISTLI